jgi:hypothetical protein
MRRWPYHLVCLQVLQRVEPLLRDDREMGGYTRIVSGQRLGKHVPRLLIMQLLDNYGRAVFHVVRAERF